MIIIKNNPDIGLSILVGEMLNLEAGRRLFSNGELLENPGPPGSYPVHTMGAREFKSRLALGIIYVSYECDIKNLINTLTHLICKMEKNIDPHMENYQAISVNLHTQRSAVSHQKRTIINTPNIYVKNIKRHINAGNTERSKILARFRWNIRNIKRYQLDNPSVPKHYAIIYDTNDIIAYPHNTIVYTENLSSIMIGYSNVINIRAHLLLKRHNIHMMKLDNPDKPPIYDFTYLHYAEFNNLFIADYAEFNFTSNKCEMCSSFLHGDNYVFVVDGETMPICPMCVHSKHINKDIVNNLQHTYRVTFPTDIYDFINSVEDEVARDVYRAAYSGFTCKQLILNNAKEIDYYIMGDKYIGFPDIDDYVYTELPHLEKLKKYKVVHITITKY